MKIHVSQCGWASSNPLRTLIEQRVKEGRICSLLELGHPSSALRYEVPGSQAFSLGLNHTISFPESSDCGTSPLSKLGEPIPITDLFFVSVSVSLSIPNSIYISY